MDYRDALVVAISQSGESTDTNLVLSRAREQGAVTIGITNEASSTLAGLAEYVFLVRARREKSVAATKTYTGQVLMLYLLAYALGGRISVDDLRRLPERAQMALELEPEIAVLSERYRFMRHAVVWAGPELRQRLRVRFENDGDLLRGRRRFSSADFLHGPIAMVEPNFPAFLFAPSGATWTSIREMLDKLEQLEAETVVITDASNTEAAQRATRLIRLPRQALRALHADPLHHSRAIFAACLADQKGLDPDKPRTISKVTLTM